MKRRAGGGLGVRRSRSTPDSRELAGWAASVSYTGSPEHKTYPSFAGRPKLRSDATPCPTEYKDASVIAAWLRESILEWLALNWWALEAASHRPEDEGVDLAGAGEGFPWPALTLRSDRQQMWVRSTPRDDPSLRVHLLGSVTAVLGGDEARRALGRFIDATVRRLEESGIFDTLLQEEWSAIQGSSDDERQFAVVAASWGFDPYDVSDEATAALLSAARALRDDALLADLARAVPGISELLHGDFSERSQARVAKTFGVSELVIVHQIENQIAA